MCDFHDHGLLPPLPDDQYVLDTPRVREFVADVRDRVKIADSPRHACEQLSPLFADLLADGEWLPAAYQAPAPQSGMGGGIGGQLQASLLYVDTAHERADTIRELEAWRPVLRDGARVVLDDYTHPEFPGVR